MLQFFSQIDRRWVFLAMLLAVGIPVLTGLTFPEVPSPMVETTFDVLEDLEPGSTVLMALDYDPAGLSELQPMSEAFTRHAASRGHRLILLTLWPTGTEFCSQMERLLRNEFPDLTYGEDYVTLGYRAGQEGVIKTIVNDLPSSYASDVYGSSLSKIPMTKEMANIRDVDLIIAISGGYPGTKEWIQYAGSPQDIEVIAGTTGVQTPMLIPYLPDQMTGILGGIKAAAEYEYLLKKNYPDLTFDGLAMQRMGPQHSAHLLMILLIIIGNVLFFLGKNERRPDESVRERLEKLSNLLLKVAGVLILGGIAVVVVVQLSRNGEVGVVHVQEVTVPEVAEDAALPEKSWKEYHGVSAAEADAEGVSVSILRTAGVWLGALLTLAVFSFLYGDNPLYKLAESIFVGVSAGYAMVVGFWDELVQNLFAKLLPSLANGLGVALLDSEPETLPIVGNLWYLVPLVLGGMMLWQLMPQGGWIARWPLAFFVGATAGIKITAFFDADFLRLIDATILPLIVVLPDKSFSENLSQTIANCTIVFGVVTSLTYFFFSAEHRGVVGVTSRIGIYVLMVTFGASFAYTVMGRIALLVERLEFLAGEWLGLIG
ncbi:hypothetical protein [Calycomorphotria hydatis]|uniref:Uncharacterized protein n=1 Tax=Calycomorphotria hydatis TaxID=2528027 RepID=A0A517T6N4_9PLAN|nr:hypothetical protein [Calycomorphotria hydatis]QDT64036.1 hypothetical protein V22_12660 [Calycomorphotria hydatis]